MPRFLSVLVLSLVLVCTSAAVSATAHAAVDDGVRIDPDSAPAKEYALPLDSARSVGADSAGGGGSRRGDDARPPAFGGGITAKAAAGSESGSGRERASADGGSRGGSSSSSGSSGPPVRSGEPGVAAAAPSTSIDDGGTNGVLYSLGGAFAVLVAGGLVALALRRRQSTA